MPLGSKKSLFKIVILGNAGVGKTSLMNQFVNHRFCKNYKATIGVDFLSKELTIEDKQITLQIWDTAGQERYQSLSVALYRGADGCFLVYDVGDLTSFKYLDIWREEILTQVAIDSDDFPIVVLGNKVDLANARKVSFKKAQQWCQLKNMPYFETSAREGFNVKETFETLARLAMSREVSVEDIREEPCVNLEEQISTSWCLC